jgi:hypothetical protein
MFQPQDHPFLKHPLPQSMYSLTDAMSEQSVQQFGLLQVHSEKVNNLCFQMHSGQVIFASVTRWNIQ